MDFQTQINWRNSPHNLLIKKLDASITLDNTGVGAADFPILGFKHQSSTDARAVLYWKESTDELWLSSRGGSSDGQLVFTSAGAAEVARFDTSGDLLLQNSLQIGLGAGGGGIDITGHVNFKDTLDSDYYVQFLSASVGIAANRALTFNIGNANRTFSLQGNLTVEATSIINQDLSTDSITAQLGTLTAEQLTSTDDITMAGLFTNTPAAGDATVIVMDGATNARTWAGAAEEVHKFERTVAGSGASFNSFNNITSQLNFGYDYSGASVAAGTNFIQSQYTYLPYTGDVTIATGFGGHKHNVRASNFYLAYTGDHTSTDRDITTQLAGGYFDSFYGGDSNMTNGKVLTVNNYGGYFIGRSTAAVATAGTPVINCFGGYFEASGNTNNTTVGYGGYFKASGCDTNYGIYVEAGSTRLLDTTVTRLSSATATITASSDTTDVSGINILFINPGAAVVIGGFVGGVNGQILQVSAIANGQDITLEHVEGVGGATQDVYLHSGIDETLSTEYGGWTLTCNGTNWYDTSHAKHV